MHLQFRCVQDLRIKASVSILKGAPQAIADGGWGQPEKELQTRWPLLTYGEGEGEVLSLINRSFGDGQPVQCVHLYMCAFSASPLLFFEGRNRISERKTK